MFLHFIKKEVSDLGLQERFEDWISGFQGSEKFLFMDVEVKEYAAQMINLFLESLDISSPAKTENLTLLDFEKALIATAKKPFPAQAKQLLPQLLGEFFAYLSQSATQPAAFRWEEWMGQLEEGFLSRLRKDGSVKGETHEKKYANVGRNEPCPCGSGKKFKKCCLNLIS